MSDIQENGKNITTSLRTTVDMDQIIRRAAKKVRASKGKIYRRGGYELAVQILNDDGVAEELTIEWAL